MCYCCPLQVDLSGLLGWYDAISFSREDERRLWWPCRWREVVYVSSGLNGQPIMSNQHRSHVINSACNYRSCQTKSLFVEYRLTLVITCAIFWVLLVLLFIIVLIFCGLYYLCAPVNSMMRPLVFCCSLLWLFYWMCCNETVKHTSSGSWWRKFGCKSEYVWTWAAWWRSELSQWFSGEFHLSAAVLGLSFVTIYPISGAG